MRNPLIHALSADTLYDVLCVLRFIDCLPCADGERVELDKEEALGYFGILQCVTDAVLFEYQRLHPNPVAPSDTSITSLTELLRKAKRIPSPRLKAHLLADLDRALDMCVD